MGEIGDGWGGKHFGGAYSAAVVCLLRNKLGETEAYEVVRRSGEKRPFADLEDHAQWTSYERFRALLEAAGEALGGVALLQEAPQAGHDAFHAKRTTRVWALGSPEMFYANLAAAAAEACPVSRYEAVEVGKREWLVTHRFADGFESFPEFCAFMAGGLQLATTAFGYRPPSVIEEQCMCQGAEACVLRVRWKPINEAQRRITFLEDCVGTLEEKLEQFESVVADLVSNDDLQSVLTRTFASATGAVQAPVSMLLLEHVPPGIQSRYSSGLSEKDAEGLAARLREGDRPPGCLVTDVASNRTYFGQLAAIRLSGNYAPRDILRLQAFASFLAAALESGATLEEARRQGDTARALLELSTALADITSVEEMASKLVRAVPGVMGCDRASVLLPDTDGTFARVAAMVGYAREVDQFARTLKIPIPEDRTGEPEIVDPSSVMNYISDPDLMSKLGLRSSVVVPILVDGDWAGGIVASYVEGSELPDIHDRRDERLRGLAAQASTAFRNARLLDQMRHQALHDSLTGLPNRALIIDRVNQMLARSSRNRQPAAVMFIDLDGFKEINDSFGHAAGDELLRSVTARLCATIRGSDSVGRLGGDEFVVLVDGSSLDAGPELVAERLLSVLRAPFRLPDGQVAELSITASIGIATGDRMSAGELLRDADVALYRAKAAGKDRFLLFEEHMQTTVQERLLLQMDLKNALVEGQFSLLYQPICHLVSGEITGVEALLRWDHPIRGRIQPDDFISLLEESGLILDVGRWVLIEACRQAVELHSHGLHVDMAVNVSGKQLETERFSTDVEEALRITGMPPSALVVEITESTLMVDVKAAASRLRAIRALGVRVAIDDFGTGYSSLAVLRDFPVDTLKIDRAFVSGLGESGESAALIHTLIELGKSLGLTTLAEGIEDNVQYAELTQQECESGQGFLIARPMPSEELEPFLIARGTAPAGASRAGIV